MVHHIIIKGHLFAEIKQVKDSNLLTDIKNFYIDDICVDEKYREKP